MAQVNKIPLPDDGSVPVDGGAYRSEDPHAKSARLEAEMLVLREQLAEADTYCGDLPMVPWKAFHKPKRCPLCDYHDKYGPHLTSRQSPTQPDLLLWQCPECTAEWHSCFRCQQPKTVGFIKRTITNWSKNRRAIDKFEFFMFGCLIFCLGWVTALACFSYAGKLVNL